MSALPAGNVGSAPAADERDCPIPRQGQPVRVSRVIDGDSLEIDGGSTLRLIGINAPELHASRDTHRHWAQVAREALRSQIEGRTLEMLPGPDATDHHQRRLAHLRNEDGRLISAWLIERGLALAVAVGRNTRCAEHLMQLERKAQQQRRGFWQRLDPPWRLDMPMADATPDNFVLVKDRIVRIDDTGATRVVHLQGGIKLQRGRHWPLTGIGADRFERLAVGDRLRVRGWLDTRAGRSRLTLHHPANLEPL